MLILFLNYLHRQKKFWLLILFCIVGEWLLVPVLLRIGPDCWYLRAYLPWTAVLKTERFAQGKMHIQPDPKRGWRNQNGLLQKNLAGKKQRLLIQGDSRMNYSNVAAHQSITRFLERNEFCVLNQATEMYGLDQSVLALEEGLEQFRPDFVVIALGTDTGDHLDCHYLPFLYPTIGLPLLKPKFVIEADSLKIVSVAPFIEKKTLLFDSDLLEFLKKSDPHYQRFEWFKQRRVTPFFGLVSLTREWLINTKKLFRASPPQMTIPNQKIVAALILESKRLTEKYHAKLFYLLLPRQADLINNQQEAYRILSRLMAENSIEFLNAMVLFQENAAQIQIFDPDGVHFTASANQLLAQALMKRLRSQKALVAR